MKISTQIRLLLTLEYLESGLEKTWKMSSNSMTSKWAFDFNIILIRFSESPHEQKKTPTRGISPLARETHITEQYPGEQIPTAERKGLNWLAPTCRYYLLTCLYTVDFLNCWSDLKSPTPKSPAAQKNSTPQPPPAKVSQEPEVEAPAKTASQPVTPSEEPEEIGTGGRFLTEVNGTFQMDFQVENVGEDELSEEESPIKSKVKQIFFFFFYICFESVMTRFQSISRRTAWQKSKRS